MKPSVLQKYNDVPGAPKVFFAPINTYSTDFCDVFAVNGFEVYSLNFAGNFNQEEYMKTHKPVTEKIFLDTCANVKPDWVFLMIDCSWISPEIILKAKELSPNTIFTNWTGDVRDGPKPGIVEVGRVVDITLIVSTGQIELYKKHDMKRVEFLQAGVKPCFFPMPEDDRKRLRGELQHDIVFCANNGGSYPGVPLRNEVVEKLHKTFGSRFAVYGGGWDKYKKSSRGPITYDGQQKVYNGSKIVISVNNFNNIEMYFSARQLNAMASGTLTLSCYVPGLEKYFENKHDLVWFTSADECIDLVNYYLEHEDEAINIGTNGGKNILDNHTRVIRIKEMKERLGL